MNGVASYLVIALTLLSLLGCLWLMWWTAYSRDPAAAEKARKETNTVDGSPGKTGHVWDGDLEEYNNPMPRWWLGLFILTIVFSLGYLVLYPGLGNFRGVLNWTQTSEHQVDTQVARRALDQRLAPLKNATLAELATNADAMSLAANLFAANCSTCHGSDARGARGFPNLTDSDWLYGGDSETIYQTIAEGRHGVMPALGGMLGEQGLKEVVSYVVTLNGRSAPPDWVAAGKARFESSCFACHGIDGKGNKALGAPDLTDSVWLHGGDFDSITATVVNGRDNQMPPHLETLGETKVRLLAAYVFSLPAKTQVEHSEALAHAK